MTVFQAGVQYNDWIGTTATDRSDNNSLLNRLQRDKIATDSEQLIGVRFCFNENSSETVSVSNFIAYLIEADEFDPTPNKARAVDVSMPIEELFGYFKRLDFVLTNSNMDLTNTEVDGPHY